MKRFYKVGSSLYGPRKQIKCCICGEERRDLMQIECLGIASGLAGDDYSFCYKCWHSRTLGEKILKAIGRVGGLKLLKRFVEVGE